MKKGIYTKNAKRFFVCLLANSVSERLEGENNICERYIFVEKSVRENAFLFVRVVFSKANERANNCWS